MNSPDIETAHKYYDLLQTLNNEIEKTILGQKLVVENSIISLLSKGHILLIGVPGLAKTRLVETLGTTLGLEQKRIQFTPDLMPSDIIGSEILEYENEQRNFRYVKGPIFTQLLMADEINRASPRTQSALLQAMQEYRVSVNGINYPLESPFHVMATQNPLEQEGTYPLPEAQLDRFLMQILLDYPDFETEKQIIINTTSDSNPSSKPILSGELLMNMQSFVRKMPISEIVIHKILDLVRATRPLEENQIAKKYIAMGPGPRASQALSLCVRARALFQNRLAPAFEDIQALAKPILRHRIGLNFTARADELTIDNVLDLIMEDVF